MKKTKQIAILGVLGFSLILIPTLSYAAFGNGSTGVNNQYLENGDYEGFLTSIEGTPLENIITSEEIFNTLVKIHNLREEAFTLGENIGLHNGQHAMMMGNMGMHNGHQGQFEDIFENGNYDDFLNATDETDRIRGIIGSEEQFEAMQEAHSLRENGYYKEANDILQEAGIEHPSMMKMHRGFGQQRGMGRHQ